MSAWPFTALRLCGTNVDRLMFADQLPAGAFFRKAILKLPQTGQASALPDTPDSRPDGFGRPRSAA
jgi:hypothetical protein